MRKEHGSQTIERLFADSQAYTSLHIEPTRLMIAIRECEVILPYCTMPVQLL